MTASSGACWHPRVSNAYVLERAILRQVDNLQARFCLWQKETDRHPRSGNETGITSDSSLLRLHLVHLVKGENIRR